VSSDERLDQEFNSIDAQREAGHAYVASQRAEGWIPVADDYDDGGEKRVWKRRRSRAKEKRKRKGKRQGEEETERNEKRPTNKWRIKPKKKGKRSKERTSTHINSDEVQRTHTYNYTKNHDPYNHYQHTNT
jgi:hypothetical protein